MYLGGQLAGAWLIGSLVFPIIMLIWTTQGWVRPNYQGRLIPVGVGVGFIISLGLLNLISDDPTPDYFLVPLLLITLTGWVDDAAGNRDALGFRGHLGALWREGRLTTGLFKAMVGGGLALAVSLTINTNWLEGLIDWLLIALMTNALNLLDLRPGRALKGFALAAILLIVVGMPIVRLYAIRLLGLALALAGYDLRSRAMMGDAGANFLGLSLGILTAINLTLPAEAGLLAGLIWLHGYCERHSLTEYIQSHRWLNYLDELGRN